jgi:quercetin dioxygenase-like cupin family protein
MTAHNLLRPVDVQTFAQSQLQLLQCASLALTEEVPMMLFRRRFLHLAGGAAAALTATSRIGLAQVRQGGPKLIQLLKADLQGQGQKVQETVVNILEMGPGAVAPWHMHPGAQELIFVLDGNLVAEIEGQKAKEVKAGEVMLIPAEVPHLVRNDDANAMARALVTHSRADKEKTFLVILKRSS